MTRTPAWTAESAGFNPPQPLQLDWTCNPGDPYQPMKITLVWSEQELQVSLCSVFSVKQKAGKLKSLVSFGSS